MINEKTTNNREYLAFILAGGHSKDPYRLIRCAVDATGEIVFSRVVEMYGEMGGGYNIQITGPDGNFEIWMGHGSEYVAIVFREKDTEPAPDTAPVPAIAVTPAEVLESLKRWKNYPNVQEAITEKGSTVVLEYWDANDADQPVHAGQ